MKVSKDKYELPLAVADSASELASILGCSANTIYSSISHAKDGRQKTQYRRVKIDEGDEE